MHLYCRCEISGRGHRLPTHESNQEFETGVNPAGDESLKIGHLTNYIKIIQYHIDLYITQEI